MTKENDVEVAKTEFSVSNGLAQRLRNMNISIAVSSYQSNLMYLIGHNKQNGINIHLTPIPRPMGISVEDRGDKPLKNNSLIVSSNHSIMHFENTLEQDQEVNGAFDACFVPRMIYLTGSLDAHDVGFAGKRAPAFVNTRFNCLAVPSSKYSFEMIWKPSFISALVDEDRCHLNGMAIKDGQPKYVTAVSQSDTIDGWRDRRANGGVVIDVESSEIVCEGLSMPHSPRLHNGQLWILNSGTGELGTVTLEGSDKGTFQPVAFCPGFLRGLSFHENLAIVGLSKPRYKRFEGLALDEKLKTADSEPWCGIQLVDITSGTCVEWLRLDGNVGELYDVEVISGVTCPMAIAPASNDISDLITYEGMKTTAPKVEAVPP